MSKNEEAPTETEYAHPDRPYDAVGESGRRGALFSIIIAGVVIVVVIVGLFAFGGGSETGLDTSPGAPSAGETGDEKPREFTADSPFQRGAAEAGYGTEGATDLRALADCSGCPLMIPIPLGTGVMGITRDEAFGERVPRLHIESELPRHGVTISNAFSLGQTEVTRRQFQAFVDATGHEASGCTVPTDAGWVYDESKTWQDPGFSQDDDHPVICVSYRDAIAYASWLSGKTDKRYRLPSETEWEYAARAGTISAHFWNADPGGPCKFANVADETHHGRFPAKPDNALFPCQSGYVYTAPAATFAASPFGLFDVFGNVREVVADCWNRNHWGKGLGGAPRTTGACNGAVVKGGGWDDAPHNVRASRRFKVGRDNRRADQGFRVAKDIPVVVEAE